MAFCTICGSQVAGAFCNQCGAPAPGSAAKPGPPPPSPPPAYGAPPPAYGAPPPQPGPFQPGVPQPMPRKTSPLVWVLVAVFGFFLLCGIFIVGVTMFAVHKVKQAGFDPDLMRRNPGMAVGKMIMAANPDAEVVSSDDANGTITVRDRNTGKLATMTFDQAKNGKFTFSARDDNGKTATMEIGGGAGKLPSWVPEYPGSTAAGTFSIKGSADGMADAGSFTFTTPDDGTKVMSFYRDKAKELGLKVNMETTTPKGGMITAVDEGEEHSLMVIVARDSGQTQVSVTYGRKK
jgi:hypothetical protein